MGNDEASCLIPNIGGRDTEISKEAKGGYYNKTNLKNKK